MVKLKIKNDNAEDEVKVPELTLYLETDDKGGVTLYANSANDIVWDILSITPEGKYRLAACLGENIGLQVDESGYIKKEG